MTALDQARQFLASLPQAKIDAGGADLHEAVARLSAVVAEFDERKPAAHIRASTLAELADPRIGGIGVGLNKEPGVGTIPIYTAPPASSDLLATVKAFANGYLAQERADARLCCDAQHHADICGLFAAIEREEKRGAA
jgi:hypothetical protein